MVVPNREIVNTNIISSISAISDPLESKAVSEDMSGMVYTGVEVRRIDLWNDLGFSLCAAPSVCCMVATSDNRKKFEMGVSADWYVTVEHWKSSLIRVIFVNYQTSKL